MSKERYCKHRIVGSLCDLGGMCIPRPNTNCPKEWFWNDGIFDGAKFGDRFKTRNGKLAIFLGRDRTCCNNYLLAIEEEDSGSCYSVSSAGVLTLGWENNFDIMCKWEEEIDQPLITGSDI